MSTGPSPKWRDAHLPQHALGKVFCPNCGQPIQGVRVKTTAFGEYKFLLPCEHRLHPVQEEHMVQDIFKKGL